MDEKEELYKKLSEVGNDQDFKMYILKKIDTLDRNHNKLDKNFSIFKVKAYMVIAAIIGAKEAIIRSFFG